MASAKTSTGEVNCDVAAAQVVTVLHYYATGPGQELHQWLVARQAGESALLEHPFPFSNRHYAVFERCLHGRTISTRKYPRRRCPQALRYALDFLRTLRIVLASGRVYDVFVGNGCFDTLAGIVLRRLRRVRRVILYTIDYAPRAAGSGWYAWIYCRIDGFCCRHADAIWNLSQRMMDGRRTLGENLRKCARAIWVPHGTHASAMAARLPARVDPCRIAFLGHLQEKSGLQLFIEAMPVLLQTFPALRLEVLGSGPYQPRIEELAQRLGVAERVHFHGFIERHEEVENVLAQCGIGLALYQPDENDFSQYCDPGKPKVYMACGLPVVIVDVPEVASLIEQRGAGRKISYDRNEMIAAIQAIIAQHDQFRARAVEVAKEFEWDAVFARAWRETFDPACEVQNHKS